jgi:hypothetical protein
MSRQAANRTVGSDTIEFSTETDHGGNGGTILLGKGDVCLSNP